jgi:DNA-binding transcriptional MocR family regulator
VYRAAADPAIIPLGAACPHPGLFPAANLMRLTGTMARRLGPRINDYDMPPGLPELRRQIARRSLNLGCPLTSDDLVTTCGCTEAVALSLLAVAGPGDTIAVESPTYYGFLRTIESLNMKALEIATDPREGMEPDALERALRRGRVKAVLVMPSFHNPLGSCMPEARRRRMVELVTRYDVPLIEDDIYGDLAFDGERPPPAKAYDRKGLVLLCSSFSKTLAPGFRIGWVAPGRYRDTVARLKASLSLSVSTPLQWTLAEYLHTGGYDHLLRRLRRTFAHQVRQMSDAVSRTFPEGTRISRPLGGFVLWVELPRRVDAMGLFDEAIEAGISLAPGHLFSPGHAFRHVIRLNCGHPWSERIEHAVSTIARLATPPPTARKYNHPP